MSIGACLLGCTVSVLSTAGCRTVVGSDDATGTSAFEGVVYFTPKQLLRLSVEKNDSGVEVALEVPDPVPDLDHRFVANANFDAFASDSVTIETTASGLLEKVTVSSKDETGLIVVELAEIAKELARLGAAFPGAEVASVEVEKISVEFDPALLASDAGALASFNAALGKAGLMLDIQRQGTAPTNWTKPSKSESADGIVYRRSELYRVDVMTKNTGQLIVSEHILLPTGPFAVIPIEAAPFVETKYEITFDKGQLASVASTRPGPVLGAVSMIPDALKEIISIPAEIIQLKIDYSKAEGDLLDQNKRIVELQKELLEARKALTEAQEAGTSSGKSF